MFSTFFNTVACISTLFPLWLNSILPYGCVCQLLSRVWLFATPRTVACQAPPSKSTGVDCCFLLQEIFPAPGSNPGLLHCRQILYHLSCQGILLTIRIVHILFILLSADGYLGCFHFLANTNNTAMNTCTQVYGWMIHVKIWCFGIYELNKTLKLISLVYTCHAANYLKYMACIFIFLCDSTNVVSNSFKSYCLLSI